MYSTILCPVDLGHLSDLGKALRVAADLANCYGAQVVFVGVTASMPTPQGRNPDEFAAHLADFASAQSEAHGIKATSHAMVSPDPTTDVDDTLLKAIAEVGADLVVMQSHDPGLIDYVWPSNGGKIASHAHVSVMVVRD